ncbi:hypothetical protein EI200_08805 [Peribacillus simplex]|uniref:hypothetical protein n=1 Tax=Peribacillus simplex TaxID=1478 RepID=UPI000F642205|nr:hypothetical protein [Peribacillus simplex]RRN72291.1 hypothetical protein EI200_08805 [Peribacillus simplex]
MIIQFDGKALRTKVRNEMLRGNNLFFGDTIYLLFALLMPLLFAIVVCIFIRSTKRQKDSLTKIESGHKDSPEK